jgi:ABC-2 type transport system ATP-binding protein
LPAALLPQLVERTGDDCLLALPSYQALEPMLAQLREAAVGVLEMELLQADLEEVFLRVVGRGAQ